MKKINFISLFLLSFLFITNLQSQNLVPNPSFEIYDTCQREIVCPYLVGLDTSVTFWFNPTTASPDYDNICDSNSNPSYSVPQNMFGYQFARTGSAYVDIGVIIKCPSTPTGYKEYIEVKLNDPLRKNNKYCVRFYVSLADSSSYALDNIGLYFSDTLISNNSDTNLSFIPQIQNPIGNFLSNKKNWVLISGEYEAHGGEYYITIGDFSSDTNADTINIPGGSHILQPETVYYIDDVSVMLCSDTAGINEVAEKGIEMNIFPNPTSENVTVTFGNVSNDKCTFELFDIIGNKVFSKEIVANQNSIIIPLDNVAKGVYICKIINTNNIKLYNSKLVIIK